MQLAPEVTVEDDELIAFCQANGILRLSLFGSALRGELRPDSDIDLLVEFEPGRSPGLLALAALELELGAVLGREVELVSESGAPRGERRVLLYKAGRTREGGAAAASHTASAVGDYDICRDLTREAGVVLVPSLDVFDDWVVTHAQARPDPCLAFKNR